MSTNNKIHSSNSPSSGGGGGGDDNAANYNYLYTLSPDKKTLTVTVTKVTAAVLGLLQFSTAPAGISLNILVKGN